MAAGDNNYYLDVNLNRYMDGMDFTQFPRAVERGIANGKRELREKLEEKCLEYMTDMGLGGSNLMATMIFHEHNDGILIMVGEEYGAFVEYGTGIVGSNNPHPHPWAYDVNAHGDDGWIYKGADGKRHWTAGQPSRPFMYKTWLWGTRSASPIMRKHIRAELKKIKGLKG